MAFWTIFFCRGVPSLPEGSGRNSWKPNHLVSSRVGSWRSWHHWQSELVARGVSKLFENPARFRELEQYPRGHDRIGAGGRQPSQDVGQRPSLFSGALSTI